MYGEEKIGVDNHQYRVWDPSRSKLASSVLEGLPCIPVNKGDAVLYLGAANGTTASHISDIVGDSGVVYCVEFSSTPFGDLIRLAEHRENIFPVLADARRPENYTFLVGGVDVLYCDLAQPHQSEVVVANAPLFLRSKGHLLYAIKASSVDRLAHPLQIYQAELAKLSPQFTIQSRIDLGKYQKKHIFVWGVYSP